MPIISFLLSEWGLLYHTQAWVWGLAHGLMIFTPIRRKSAKQVDIGKYICTIKQGALHCIAILGEYDLNLFVTFCKCVPIMTLESVKNKNMIEQVQYIHKDTYIEFIENSREEHRSSYDTSTYTIQRSQDQTQFNIHQSAQSYLVTNDNLTPQTIIATNI